MKKIILTITLVILLLFIIGFGFLYEGNYLGKRPFENLEADSIENATVFVIPPEVTATVSNKDTLIKLAEILNRITIYQQDDSGRENNGQLVQFTITLTTGDTHEIGVYGSFVYIDSVCYKAKYNPSQELNALGNRIFQDVQ